MDELWSSRSRVTRTVRVQLGGMDAIKIGLVHMEKIIVPGSINVLDAGCSEARSLGFEAQLERERERQSFRWVPMFHSISGVLKRNYSIKE